MSVDAFELQPITARHVDGEQNHGKLRLESINHPNSAFSEISAELSNALKWENEK
jgi:hypothetical protein